MRPRDIVKFIVICCKTAMARKNEKICRDDVKQATVEYSHWFKREFDDEVQVVLPDMEVIWRILSDIKLQIFNKDDFYAVYEKYKSKLINKDASFILEQLFEFSIVGNQDRANQTRFYFKYEYADMKFNEDTRVKIPATIQFLRLGYEYQSLRDADIDFATKIFINRFKPALEKINNREISFDEIKSKVI